MIAADVGSRGLMAVQISHDDIDADMAFHAFRDYACPPNFSSLRLHRIKEITAKLDYPAQEARRRAARSKDWFCSDTIYQLTTVRGLHFEP